jgi:quercetin dioxygenase-like cupin family protein
VVHEGARVRGGPIDAEVKVGRTTSSALSMLEINVPPGFDVGAHRHDEGEEVFYVLEGELEAFAFHPVVAAGPWPTWESGDGERPASVGAGSVLHVPTGCPHAFRNTSGEVVRMLLVTTPAGHEEYLAELAGIIERGGEDVATSVEELRGRHGIEQMSVLRSAPPGPG